MDSRIQSPALARVFAALADNTRLRLLNLMAGREVCVCYFVQILRQGQPKISRHLAYLRKAAKANGCTTAFPHPPMPPRPPSSLPSSLLCATTGRCRLIWLSSTAPAALRKGSLFQRALPARLSLARSGKPGNGL